MNEKFERLIERAEQLMARALLHTRRQHAGPSSRGTGNPAPPLFAFVFDMT